MNPYQVCENAAAISFLFHPFGVWSIISSFTCYNLVIPSGLIQSKQFFFSLSSNRENVTGQSTFEYGPRFFVF